VDPKDREQPSKDDIYTLKVTADTDFFTKPAWNKINQEGPIPADVKPRRLVTYSEDGKFTPRRLAFVDLRDGKYLLIWEIWSIAHWLGGGASRPDWGAYDSTWAMLVDENGAQTTAPKSLGAVRIQKNSDAVFLPKSKKVAWVSGDAANDRLMMYTLDESLNLKTYPLTLP